MENINQQPNWVELNSEWESSGLPQKKFCKARDVSYSLFVYERGKLLDKNRKKPKPVFSAARVVPASISEVSQNLVLRLPTGMRLDIPPRSDLTQVGQLLALLGMAPC
jgi:hypothetical protein